MLDENARKVLMEEALFRILRFSTLFSKYGRGTLFPEYNLSNWPGSEIPRWFSHKSEGSSICINLPHPDHQWYNSSYLGLAFCLIVEFKDLMLSPIWPMLNAEFTYMFPNGDSWRQRRNMDFPNAYSYEVSLCDGCCQFPFKETSEKNINGCLNSEYVCVFMDNSFGKFLTFDFPEEYSEESGEYIEAKEGRFNNEIAACSTSTATASFSFSCWRVYQVLATEDGEAFGFEVALFSGFDFEMEAKTPSVADEEVKATETFHSDPRT
ncbi:hypothetical protein TIFTF001_044845 [Ficus carica]|uniref:C-JID domain-containing protein n=1 Tax=Ficus carica TaxID=3494 RepID=A0AA88CXT4_FICCA|nr:hypothetical protein TIFTF001_044845 [Ficus carica]